MKELDYVVLLYAIGTAYFNMHTLKVGTSLHISGVYLELVLTDFSFHKFSVWCYSFWVFFHDVPTRRRVSVRLDRIMFYRQYPLL